MSDRNRCVIKVFGGVYYVVTMRLRFFFYGCRGFCHRTESDLFLFSSPEPKARVSYCHSAPSVVRPSVVVRKLFNFFSRTAWWILMKLGRDEVLMVPYKCCCFSARSAKGRIQGGAKIGHRGPLLKKTSSSDRRATATNQMYSSDLEACGKKCCYFLFHSKIKFLTHFDVFLDLVIFANFNVISIGSIRLSALFAFILCKYHVCKW